MRELTRSAVLVRFGHALAEGLVAGEDVDDALRLLVPGHADWCVLHLVEGSRVRRAAVVHADPQIERALRETFQPRARSSADARRRSGACDSNRAGPRFARSVTEAMLASQPESGRAARRRALAVTSACPSKPAMRRSAR